VNHIDRRLLASGAVALALGLATPAWAGGPMPGGGGGGAKSGGPGTLGTEVPFDSREAEMYYQVFLPTNTPEALRIRDGIQRLHAVHEAALGLAEAGAVSANSQVRQFAQTLREDHVRLDEALRQYFQVSRFEMTGAAYQEKRREAIDAAGELQTAKGAALDRAFLSQTAALLEREVADINELVPQAREARRQVLTSHLQRERKRLRAHVAAAREIQPPAPEPPAAEPPAAVPAPAVPAPAEPAPAEPAPAEPPAAERPAPDAG
jgi:predicted outer membrane protein